jgi:hypothetical protein
MKNAWYKTKKYFTWDEIGYSYQDYKVLEGHNLL